VSTSQIKELMAKRQQKDLPDFRDTTSQEETEEPGDGLILSGDHKTEDPDTPPSSATVEVADEDLSHEEWTKKIVGALESTRDQFTARFAMIEKKTDDKVEQLNAALAAVEAKTSALMEAEAVFYRRVKVEMPEILKTNFTAISQGITEGHLELLVTDIEKDIDRILTNRVATACETIEKSCISIRLAASEVEDKTGGWKYWLRQAGIAAAIGAVIFFSLKTEMGLGVDASYGRNARAVIEHLDKGNRAIIEQAIYSK
jgi:hypothetical protein